MAKAKTGKMKKAAVTTKKPAKKIPGEMVFRTPRGIAVRTAETKDEFRMLITVRAGRDLEQVQFNLGSGGGVQAFGGDPGGPPTCP
jgi:hypothetical protein